MVKHLSYDGHAIVKVDFVVLSVPGGSKVQGSMLRVPASSFLLAVTGSMFYV